MNWVAKYTYRINKHCLNKSMFEILNIKNVLLLKT